MKILEQSKEPSLGNSPQERSLFLKKTSLALTFLFLLPFAAVITYKLFKDWYLIQFINFKSWTYYNTFSLLLILFCILIPTFLVKFGRIFGLIFYLGIVFCYAHFGSWLIVYVTKIQVFGSKMYHIILFTLVSNIIATCLSCLMQKGGKFDPITGILIGMFLNLVA